MREIKFRCWDKENKEMLDVEYLHWDDCTREFSIRTTMGLSALETAFAELDFDNPMSIKEVHKLYKELEKKYFEERCK